MRRLPIECKARYDAIHTLARELSTTFINGSRKDMLEGLVELEPKVALAVLAHITATCSKDTRDSISRFLTEMA